MSIQKECVIVQICIALINGMFTPETVWGLVIFGKICIFKGIFLARNVYSRLSSIKLVTYWTFKTSDIQNVKLATYRIFTTLDIRNLIFRYW